MTEIVVEPVQMRGWGLFTGKNAIWERRYHDDRVLLHDKKVKAHNMVELKEKRADGSPRLTGPFYISGKTVRKYKKEMMPTKAGGLAPMRPVPFNEFKPMKIDRRWS